MPRPSKTNEQFQKEAKENNHKVTVTGIYISRLKKVTVKCNFCTRDEWEMDISNILRGTGCRKCSDILRGKKLKGKPSPKKGKPGIKRTLTPEQHFELNEHRKQNCNTLHNFRYDYSQSDLTASDEPTTISCPIHGTFQQSYDKHHNGGRGCPVCGVFKRGESRAVSVEEHDAEIKTIHPNITRIGPWRRAHKKTLYRCNCGYEWLVLPSSLKRGTGCPECGAIKRAKSRLRTPEDVDTEILKINPNIERVGPFKGMSVKTIYKCINNGCFFEWSVTPSHLKTGTGCPKCAEKNRGKQSIKITKKGYKQPCGFLETVEDCRAKGKVMAICHGGYPGCTKNKPVLYLAETLLNHNRKSCGCYNRWMLTQQEGHNETVLERDGDDSIPHYMYYRTLVNGYLIGDKHGVSGGTTRRFPKKMTTKIEVYEAGQKTLAEASKEIKRIYKEKGYFTTNKALVGNYDGKTECITPGKEKQARRIFHRIAKKYGLRILTKEEIDMKKI